MDHWTLAHADSFQTMKLHIPPLDTLSPAQRYHLAQYLRITRFLPLLNLILTRIASSPPDPTTFPSTPPTAATTALHPPPPPPTKKHPNPPPPPPTPPHPPTHIPSPIAQPPRPYPLHKTPVKPHLVPVDNAGYINSPSTSPSLCSNTPSPPSFKSEAWCGCSRLV